VLKADGVKSVWVDGKLSAECRTALRLIDQHFHDLRREAGSRWHEGGFQLHEVRGLLGHANVSQTDTYLSARIAGLRDSMKRFDAARGKSVAKSNAMEQRLLGHEETEESRKDQLH
jgi:integrase